jgi:hypothetical protein
MNINLFFYNMPLNIDTSAVTAPLSGFFGKTLKSPFWLALLITVVLILIIIFVYPAKKSSSITKLIKLMLYMYVVILICLFVHDNVLSETWKQEHEDASSRNLIGQMSEFIKTGAETVGPRVPTTDIIKSN